MSYTPTTWAAGDTVTAAKLNKLEQGVASGSGVLVVNMTWDGSTATATADKTASEIYNAAQSGVVAFKEDDGEGYSAVGLLHSVRLDHGAYEFYVGNGDGCYVFTASSGSEYPEYSGG